MRLNLGLVSILVLVLSITLATPAFAAPGTAVQDTRSLANRAVDLANQERLKAGLNPLKWNDQLAASATAYAQEMATKGIFAHVAPDGSNPTERAKRAGYPAYGWGGLYVGENLGRGYNTAESVHEAWMASEGHRQNLLLPKYREIGIGIAVASNGTVYWAQEFGSRPNALPVFINDDSGATDSARVTLRLTDEEVSPWGSLAAITSVMVSNRPDFSRAAWEPFAFTKAWTLAGRPGAQTVYVRFMDANGQVVESSDDIQYVGSVALSLDEPQLLAGSESPSTADAQQGDPGPLALDATPTRDDVLSDQLSLEVVGVGNQG